MLEQRSARKSQEQPRSPKCHGRSEEWEGVELLMLRVRSFCISDVRNKDRHVVREGIKNPIMF